ncbi:MAG: FkbM family methyltransferase [Methanosarcinales archaeon]|nr:FkbM family methyltransferase [Methanosarcinales archaeon]
MLKIIEKIMDRLILPIPNFQNYINNRYNRKGHTVIPINVLKKLYYENIGLRFISDEQLDTVYSINDYKFLDIKETDVVLDIGANIGAFSMIASKKAKHVYAIEPLFSDEIKDNISVNNIKNITVIESGLGSLGGGQWLSYGSKSKLVSLLPLLKIIELCGGHIDFLKCDCEGGEWIIKPDDLIGIRRIEAEIHCFNKEHEISEFESILEIAGFKYETEILSESTMIIHACKL